MKFITLSHGLYCISAAKNTDWEMVKMVDGCACIGSAFTSRNKAWAPLHHNDGLSLSGTNEIRGSN
ncbi:MAG: hypothetical protein ACTHJ8_03035 [Mucilaginibacter sp.]